MFSLVIAILAAIPPLIRQNVPQFVINLIVLFGRILICWFIHHFFLLHDFRQGYKRPSGMRIFASCALATVIIFLIPILLKEDFVLGAGFSRLKTSQQWMVNLFRSAVISIFTYFVVYYNQVNLQLQKSRLENEYLKQDQLKAQLFSLQQQISPHFLFNSLSTLRTIAPDPMTKTYVMQLANVYRYLLAVHESPRITLQAELAFTESYLYILHERYENALQVSIGIEPALLH
jgi:sensor histidine kinase YesM